MVKKTRLFFWILAVVLISGVNLSSMCKPQPEEAQDQFVRTFGSTETLATTAVSGSEVEVPNVSGSDEIKELTWRTLSDVEFKDVYVEELDAYYWKPTFGESVVALEGEEVYITGYVIPVDYDSDFYVLSRYPFANCYFCGGAGPESVIDLRFESKSRAYKTDERLSFKGVLKLNADDVYQMNYILEGAKEYN